MRSWSGGIRSGATDERHTAATGGLSCFFVGPPGGPMDLNSNSAAVLRPRAAEPARESPWTLE